MTVSLVTGAAGFIGSRLCAKLVESGANVRGVDSFVDYYPRKIKEENLRPLKGAKGYSFVEADLATCDLDKLLDGVDVVYHIAAQAGVRASWGSSFKVYIDCNIVATQRLLEACKSRKIKKFVYASSSSVYGESGVGRMVETQATLPRSPYGVTKLAAENLCSLYHANFGAPTVSLRFFTVFGPGQRPDMAMHRFLRSCLDGSQVKLFGDGAQTRDFTYVDDIVKGVVLAAEKGAPGRIYNLGGGNRISMNDLIALMTDIAGKAPNVLRADKQPGDVGHTWADTTLAKTDMGWVPDFNLRDGLKNELDWLRTALQKRLLD